LPLYALDGHKPQTPDKEGYWVAPDANIIGKILLHEDVGVWFGAVLRGDNELITVGRGSNIQEHAMLHTDMGFPLTIGYHCTIGHRAILHGCTIGNNTLIGMGAIILNGAVIGDNCLVGAGALVTEGKVFPDNSLIVGQPAKAIRTLDEASAARLTQSAENYVLNWKRFSLGLARVD
jgi:carbonic anhydrase/acetyltransferase-like protein (isoleucine patch superfamily)